MAKTRGESIRRFIQMTVGIFGIGVFLSLLIQVNYGTDTCSFMNLALSHKFGITFGTCMVIVNTILFIPVILFQRKLIHIGTVMNMMLVGYISDFFSPVWRSIIPSAFFLVEPYRPLLFVVGLIPFLMSVALYINADMGQAPYDAIPTIVSSKLKLGYAPTRILWDFSVVLVGMAAGKQLTVATVILALTIGPAVTQVGRFMKYTSLRVSQERA
jgi:uncharacterized membrane protein YczE